jgi:hypothetical protein
VTKRLQVLLDDAELRTIQRAARRDKLTTAEWVRRRLREGAASARGDTSSKLAAIHTAYRHNIGPSPDIDQMLDEIEQGYLSGEPKA